MGEAILAGSKRIQSRHPCDLVRNVQLAVLLCPRTSRCLSVYGTLAGKHAARFLFQHYTSELIRLIVVFLYAYS